MKLAAAGLLCALMTACGGGGDSENGESLTPDGSATTPIAEGRWVGKMGTDTAVALTVLETGEIWGFSISHPNVFNKLFGNVFSKNFQLNGELNELSLTSGYLRKMEFTGSVVPKTSMEFTLPHKPHVSLEYDAGYEQPANPGELTGSYGGTGFVMRTPSSRPAYQISSGGQVTLLPSHAAYQLPIALDISASGEMSIASLKDCTASGTALPRPTGKNVFDVALSFHGSACNLFVGTTFRGIASYEPNSEIVLIQALSDNKAEGLYFTAPKRK